MLALLLIASASAPCGDLPLEPGATWSYRVEAAWSAGDTVRHRTFTWTTTVAGVRTSSSGSAATVVGWPADLAWWTPETRPDTSVLYCVAGHVYLVRPAPGRAAQAAGDLIAGRRVPVDADLILRLPLRVGDLYGRDPGARNDTFYAWSVESADRTPAALRRLVPDAADSIYSIAYRSLPDATQVGFLPGVGVVRYVYHHNGTIADTDAQLEAFRPGRR